MDNIKLSPSEFFDLEKNRIADVFSGCEYVWDGLKNIKKYLQSNLNPNIPKTSKINPTLGKTIVLHKGSIIESDFEIVQRKTSKSPYDVISGGQTLEGASIIFSGAVLFDDSIFIGENVVIEPGALVKGPAIIGDNTELRQGAYLRGDTIIGENCVVGHATEMKSSIMLGGSKAGHFAYIGDSILGRVNLGAGTKLANLKIVKTNVALCVNEVKYDTGLRKFGAIIADGVKTGCNSVTAPGTIIGRDSIVYPNTAVRGFHQPQSIIKLKQNQDIVQKRN